MPCPFLGDDIFDDTFDDNEAATAVEDTPKTILQVIEGFKSLNFYDGQLKEGNENQKTFPNKVAQYGDIQLSPELTSALEERGIEQLYVHQTEALAGLFNGQHVIVSTSTAR